MSYQDAVVAAWRPGPADDRHLLGRECRGRRIVAVDDEGEDEVTLHLDDGTVEVWTRRGIWGHEAPEARRPVQPRRRRRSAIRRVLRELLSR